jgi:DNA topoisomerase-1
MTLDATPTDLTLNAMAHAEEAGLRYVYDTDKGFTRRGAGKGFTYLNDGKVIKDAKHIDRIKKLAIPPAWKNVWICANANGHLQATGTDARGRKQYRYHADWRTRRDENKFTNMLAFGTHLPSIRRKVTAALKQDGLPREKVLAAVVRLLDRTGLRVGNDAYTAENHTYGLTTIRKKHLDLHGKEIDFDFPAKGGKVFKGTLTDAVVANVLHELEDLPGHRLFKYVDDAGDTHDIGSSDINAWLQHVTGEKITAKDFRTWNACTLFLDYAMDHCGEGSKFELKPVLQQVATHLGNTPAILKKSYVHPDLVDLYRTGCFLQKEWDHHHLKKMVTGLNRTENLLMVWLQKTYG